ELFVLDEPTNGLDPQGTREVRHLVHEVAAEGATIFVSSHLLSEIEQMCTHVGVMSHGRLVFQGTLDELGAAATTRIRLHTPEPDQAVRVLLDLGLAAPLALDGRVTAELGAADSADVTAALVRAGVPVRELLIERPDLEELFVGLTGEGF